MDSSKSVYPDWFNDPKLARQHLSYLVNKYAPDRIDLLEKLNQNTEEEPKTRYYLGEISRENNWKVNYLAEDQELVKDLFFYGGG